MKVINNYILERCFRESFINRRAGFSIGERVLGLLIGEEQSENFFFALSKFS